MQWAVPVEREAGSISSEQDMVAPAMEAVFNNKDLLKSIFEQLDLHEICIAATTCQLWNQVANHDDFWKQIDFRGKQVLPINAAALLQRHPRVEQLDLSALQGSHQGGADSTLGFVQQIAPHLTSLQRLAFSSTVKAPSLHPLGCIPDQLVQHLSMFAALTCLSLTGARLSPAIADLAHPTLRRLILDQTDASSLHIKCPELTCLSMADSPAKRMPNLDESSALLALDLSRCFKLQELSTRTTIMRLTALQELNIGGLANILDQTLQALSASLGQLTKLEMPKAAGVTFQGVLSGFPALRRLDLSRCDQLNSAALPVALESFECLESVSLDNCTLTTLKLSMSQLKDLSVCGCQGLTELDVRAWQLSRLDLGPTSCPRSCNRNLSKLTVTSGALKRMEWAELHKLSYVELDCPALTELWVRDCDFSDAAVLQSLGDTAVPPPLASDVLLWARPGAALQLAPLASGSSGAGAASTQLAGSGGAGAAAAGQAPAGGAWGVPVVDAFDFGLDGLLGDDEGQQPRGDDGEDDGGGDGDQGGGGHGGGNGGRAPLRRLLSGEAGAPAAPSTYEADVACVERCYGSWLGRDRRRGAPDKASMYFVMPGEPAVGAGDAGASSSAAAAAAAGGAGPSRLAGADPTNTGLGGSAGAGSSEAAAAAAGGSQSNQDVSNGVSGALCMGADAAGAPSNGQHASQQEQPAQMRQQQQQQHRRRHRRGGAGGTRARQQQARWRMALDCWLGSQSPSSAGAAADTDEDRWLEQEDAPMCVAAAGAPSTQEGGPSGSQQQQQQASQAAGPRQFQLHPPASCRPASHRQAAAGGGGGGGDGDSSGGSDADSDMDASGPAAGGSIGAALPRQRQRCSSNRVAAGKGGVPRLRVLHVEGCDRLKELQLSHAVLQQVSVSGCNSLVVVALHAPKLSSLELQELGDLKGACLQEVAVSSLTMGSCSTLQGMELSSTQLVLLDVRGCGGLQQLHLNCPALQVLDATFCGSLADEGLASAVANIPPLRQLALSVCCQVSSTGLSGLSKLTGLQELDLSYTEVSSLQPILDSCPRLRSLSIASCRGLGEDALLPLLDAQQPPLSQLTSLDASYCDVQDVLAAQLLLRCRQLKHLALSGCAGVTDAIWQQVEAAQLQRVQLWMRGTVAAPAGEAAALMDLDDGDDGCEGSGAELGAVDALAVPASGAGGGSGSSLAADGSSSYGSSQLESLSLVRCNNLRSLCLGLLPAEGEVELLPPKHYLLSGGRSVLQQAAPQGGWVEVPSAVSQLTSLKAGLSGVQVVALALPKLAHLDLSSCKHLRMLELRCPLLLQLQLQACTALPVVSAVRSVLGAPHLQMLDVQHMLGAAGGGSPADQDAEALDEVVAQHGSLKPGSILRCTSVCKVCHKLAEHCSLG